MRFNLLVLALSSITTACAAPAAGGASEPSGEPTMVHTIYCNTAACHDYQVYLATGPECACSNNCYADGGDGLACAEQCGCDLRSSCDRDAVPCQREDHIFRALAEPDLALEDACEASRTRDTRCGMDPHVQDCARRARVELASQTDYYRCIADTPCGRTPSCTQPAPGTVGTELSAVSATLCGAEAYVGEYWTRLNDAEFAVQSDVRAALRTCLDERSNCWNLHECIDEWRSEIGRRP